MSWGHVELEPEVEKWFLGLTHSHRGTVAFYVDLLADHGVHLGEPYTRQLSGKVRELRFHLDGSSVRVTYWIASGRRIILLTVFRKTRQHEAAELDRAVRAWAACVAQEHTVDEG
ncbi:type II toxin-antitoxin system RelE/ParE family toxin [Streptomyces sp. NBC_00094]|uniref:type II toxin-antitoxin system RelE/ParE family toxin n=1 Tax=Streptomyces sp. NBC_00094 TaxID=2903620 RepID=UPI002259E236|nr:type II toxin-antitoxin system RelE/ParE family toxin [Streptomyces sp. NBC_00094]MCX5392426.1 type II toxin-antitoxin system RelE/ParE family toxin [Streptomyces sp. NBC_00094]